MNKTIYILLFLTITATNSTIAQEQYPENSVRFLQQILQQGNKNEYYGSELSSEELMQTMSKYDFSGIWQQKNDALLGFIGENYQRLNIKFITIVKNSDDSTKYYVYGKSMVGTNICPFIGEIKLLHVRQVEIETIYKQTLYSEFQDEESAERYLAPEYVLLAKYSFFEDPKATGSGKFEGILKTNFYIYNEMVYYNDLRIEVSDPYNNNQCVGTWTSYLTGVSKTCNWGEFRIPYSGDLDIGAGLFSPDSKYLGNGWYNYSKAWIYQDTEAQKKEREKWW